MQHNNVSRCVASLRTRALHYFQRLGILGRYGAIEIVLLLFTLRNCNGKFSVQTCLVLHGFA